MVADDWGMMWTDIWYNKWAGGDREDSYHKSVFLPPPHSQ